MPAMMSGYPVPIEVHMIGFLLTCGILKRNGDQSSVHEVFVDLTDLELLDVRVVFRNHLFRRVLLLGWRQLYFHNYLLMRSSTSSRSCPLRHTITAACRHWGSYLCKACCDTRL